MVISPSQERFPNLKRLLVCFSLANLYFVSAWYRIQDVQAPFANYFRQHAPDLTVLLATLVASLLVTAAFVALSLFARRFSEYQRVTDCIFLAVVVLGLEVTRSSWPRNSVTDHLRNGGALGAEAMIFCGLILRAISGNRIVAGAAIRILLLFNFLFAALAIHFVAGWVATPRPVEFADPRPAPAAGNAGPRVLWMLFDSLDQRMTFDARHASLQLPELDRLRDRSFWAAEAHPPARYTSYSVPALLSGRLFQDAAPAGPNEILLTPRGGGTPVDWTTLPTIFADVRKLGLDARVTGWYHPYCRVAGQDLVECTSELGVDGRATQEAYAAHLGLGGAVGFAFDQRRDDLLSALHVATARPANQCAEVYAQLRQQQQYFAIRQRVLETVPRHAAGLYFIHWPIPHPPGLYDRRSAGFAVKPTNTYLDNLALVDRTLGELRAAMEPAGLWDTTTIIITSDHGHRPEIWNGTAGYTAEMQEAVGGSKSLTIPVLIRFPGQRKTRRYAAPWNTVLLHDLTLAVLRGEVANENQAADWLDRNRERFPTSPPQPVP